MLYVDVKVFSASYSNCIIFARYIFNENDEILISRQSRDFHEFYNISEALEIIESHWDVFKY